MKADPPLLILHYVCVRASVFETSVGSLESCFTRSACIVDTPEDRYFTSLHTLF